MEKSIILILFFLSGACSNVKTLRGHYLQITDLSSSCDIKVILLWLQYAFVKGTGLHHDSEFLWNLTEQQLVCRMCRF